jgi:hypothetical protein
MLQVPYATHCDASMHCLVPPSTRLVGTGTMVPLHVSNWRASRSHQLLFDSVNSGKVHSVELASERRISLMQSALKLQSGWFLPSYFPSIRGWFLLFEHFHQNFEISVHIHLGILVQLSMRWYSGAWKGCSSASAVRIVARRVGHMWQTSRLSPPGDNN